MLVFFALDFDVCPWCAEPHGIPISSRRELRSQAGKGKAGGHTVASVMAEATRQPDACPHVENPAPPILLFGCSLAEVESKANEWAASSTDAIGRKLRKDGLCLLAGVISAPDD